MGAKTNSIEECTVYIQAVKGKHTIGSSCAQILGKFIADTEWLDACVKQGKIIGMLTHVYVVVALAHALYRPSTW